MLSNHQRRTHPLKNDSINPNTTDKPTGTYFVTDTSVSKPTPASQLEVTTPASLTNTPLSTEPTPLGGQNLTGSRNDSFGNERTDGSKDLLNKNV